MNGKLTMVSPVNWTTQHTLTVNGGHITVDGKDVPQNSPAWDIINKALWDIQNTVDTFAAVNIDE